MAIFTEMVDVFGFSIPAWIIWALGAIFIILIVVFILKGYFSEMKK